MAAYEEYAQQIFTLLQPLAKNGHTVREETEFVADLGLSSLQIMELVEQIEDHFDLAIPINTLSDIRTLRDFAQQLEKISG